MERGTVRNPYEDTLLRTSLCKNLKELDKVFSSIVELGNGKALRIFVNVKIMLCFDEFRLILFVVIGRNS